MRNDTSPAIPKPGLRTVFLVPTWRITCAFSHLAHHDGLQPTQQMGGLKPPPAGRLRRAKPSSLTQHHINELYLHRAPLCVRGTLSFAVSRGCLFVRCWGWVVSVLGAGSGVEDEGVIDAFFWGAGPGSEGRGEFGLRVPLVAGEVDADVPSFG